MGERSRTAAQFAAAVAFRWAKRDIRTRPVSYCVLQMRNAWVAYHAGAPWMTAGCPWPEVQAMVDRQGEQLRAEVAYQSSVISNFHRGHNADQDTIAQLREDVERWRVKTDDIRKLLSAKRIEVERLTHERDEARAEVERLRSGIRDLRQGLLRGLRPGDGAEPEPMTEVSGVVACLDALAREDGADSC